MSDDLPGPETIATLLPRVTLKQLGYFVAAAQQGGVQAAAQALNISPPSVSAAIAQLERIIGTQLFIRRHARGLVLTRAGRELAAEARALLQSVRELEAPRRTARQPLTGRLDIGCIVSLAPYLLPPLMRRFQDAHPDVLVRCEEGDQESLIEGLEQGRLDAVVLYDFDVPSTIRCAALRAMPLQVLLPEGHSLAGRPTLALEDVASEPFVLLDLPRSRDYILSAFSELGIAPRVAMKARSPEMVRSLVANGFGYALLNFCPPQDRPGQGAIRSVPLAGRLRTPSLAFARPYQARSSRLVEAFHAHAAACTEELLISA